jgi:hypothetical protein
MCNVNLAKWTLGQLFFAKFWSTQPCQDPMVFESVKSACVHMVANMSNEYIVYQNALFFAIVFSKHGASQSFIFKTIVVIGI